ncbi:FHA domain-containing protein [Clostridium sp. C8-1-8]|uniref:FHA domain-containing protein n=1 Tax=Clostridium sp. C8-1-8 TaxID=2698831 RepID=UPI00136B4E7B|nr:FHA domain-containing protein [Clostridium sp. C8-1-8]
MDFKKISSVIFGVIFIIILYVIIYYALKIMYKDVKTGGKRRPSKSKKVHGIEVIKALENHDLKPGSVIPVMNSITIGRREDNSIVLNDQFVSGHHAKLYLRNDDFILEDLNSTNGTFVNDDKITGRVKLKVEDEIKFGGTIFRVID